MFKKFFMVTSLFLFLVIGCNKSPKLQNEKLIIAASIMPLVDFAIQIGGDRVEVFQIVPPGSNPHTFELTPQLVKKISNADLVLLNGVGLEFWASKITQLLDKTKIIDTSINIEILYGNDHDSHGNHDHEFGNPHIWLDPVKAKQQVIVIQNALITIDKKNKEYYSDNTKLFQIKLDSLTLNVSREITSWSSNKFICFHPAWEYFAKRFGLEQAAVIESSHGVEPGPKKIAEIIKIAEQIQAKAIFTEAEFPDVLSKMIARESNIKTISLDPLGSSQNIYTYYELITYNVSQMSKALK